MLSVAVAIQSGIVRVTDEYAYSGDGHVKGQVLAKPYPSSTLSAVIHTWITLASKLNLPAESGYLTTLSVAHMHTSDWQGD